MTTAHMVQWQDVAGAALMALCAVGGLCVLVASLLVKSGAVNGEQGGEIVASILPTGRDKQAR